MTYIPSTAVSRRSVQPTDVETTTTNGADRPSVRRKSGAASDAFCNREAPEAPKTPLFQQQTATGWLTTSEEGPAVPEETAFLHAYFEFLALSSQDRKNAFFGLQEAWARLTVLQQARVERTVRALLSETARATDSGNPSSDAPAPSNAGTPFPATTNVPVTPGLSGVANSESDRLVGGLPGAGTMHGTAGAPDTTPLPGPGAGPWDIDTRPIGKNGSACSTILVRQDGMPFVLSTDIGLPPTPVARLLDPATGEPLAELDVEAGALLGGVYAYLDVNDNMVLVDGDQNLRRIKATRDDNGEWRLESASPVSLKEYVGDDAVVAINPGPNDTVWFATDGGKVGIYDPCNCDAPVQTLQLEEGEQLANSFSTTPDGRAAIMTDRALYVVGTDQTTGELTTHWRQEYENCGARKPGQLSEGSGTTPTIATIDGRDCVVICDNAEDSMNLLVYDYETGEKLIDEPLPGNIKGTENSVIVEDGCVYVASTYGYTYPTADTWKDFTVPFEGGMVKYEIDLSGDKPDASLRWSQPWRSCAVPKLSTADGLIYTVVRQDVGPGQVIPGYAFAAIDPATGDIVNQQQLPRYDRMETPGLFRAATFFAPNLRHMLNNPLQMAPTIGADGTLYQGTMSGIAIVSPVQL